MLDKLADEGKLVHIWRRYDSKPHGRSDDNHKRSDRHFGRNKERYEATEALFTWHQGDIQNIILETDQYR